VEASKPPRYIVFGAFEADLSNGKLRKYGLKIRLQPQAFLLLSYLLQHPGEVFSIEHLSRKLWPHSTGDADKAVKIAINKIRAVLSDSAVNPRFVETVARRGYRFIMPISTPRPSREPSERIRLAVLPFAALRPADQSFSAGITAEVIRQLSSLDRSRLGVVSGASSTRYAQQGKGLDQMGRELGVDYLVEGTVFRFGGRVRVNSRLIRIRDQVHAWAQTYEGRASDSLTFQTDVARWVARAVELEVLVSPDSRASA
jgi:TolB-like protein